MDEIQNWAPSAYHFLREGGICVLRMIMLLSIAQEHYLSSCPFFRALYEKQTQGGLSSSHSTQTSSNLPSEQKLRQFAKCWAGIDSSLEYYLRKWAYLLWTEHHWREVNGVGTRCLSCPLFAVFKLSRPMFGLFCCTISRAVICYFSLPI